MISKPADGLPKTNKRATNHAKSRTAERNRPATVSAELRLQMNGPVASLGGGGGKLRRDAGLVEVSRRAPVSGDQNRFAYMVVLLLFELADFDPTTTATIAPRPTQPKPKTLGSAVAAIAAPRGFTIE